MNEHPPKQNEETRNEQVNNPEKNRGKLSKRGQKIVIAVLLATQIVAGAIGSTRGRNKPPKPDPGTTTSTSTEYKQPRETTSTSPFEIVTEPTEEDTTTTNETDPSQLEISTTSTMIEPTGSSSEKTTEEIESTSQNISTKAESIDNSSETEKTEKFEYHFSEKNPTVNEAIAKINKMLENSVDLKTNDRLSKLLEIYEQIGMTKETACAIAGNNLQEERTLTTKRTEGGIGIFQFDYIAPTYLEWLKNNHENDYDDFQNGKSDNNWERHILLQTEYFMIAEHSGWATLFEKGNNGEDVSTLVVYFSDKIERPNPKYANNGKRKEFAEKVVDEIEEGSTNLSSISG